jgi:hypothetical protein
VRAQEHARCAAHGKRTCGEAGEVQSGVLTCLAAINSAARTLASVTKASGVGTKIGGGSLSIGQSGGMEALMMGRGLSSGGGRPGRIGSTFIDAQLEELRNMQVGGA